ncbi:hypothetical protein LSF60_16505 [Rhodococcus pyridinivorans]|uniref:hypothetical protein n=1 Tax=Rhodococcus pyridinivorans TaxID=103816 RepID=UPI001E2DFEB0|nr:hypothetical protein [Rhodococcus pyridinivorans]UGQ56904.1 hypothetical protein LSF60_16505 [Rhodococcus pyridinivorans]
MNEIQTSEEIPESVIEWLGLIRYQTLLSIEQSRFAPPLSALAINSIQDSVESALSLVVQQKGGAISNKPDFLQLFDAAVTHGTDPDLLKSFRPALSALNTARVGFKHHGNAPSDQAIQRHCERGSEFVHMLVRNVFSIELETVSLLTFVKNDDTRALLEEAQSSWNAGKHNEGLEAIRLAFDKLVQDYTGRKQWSPGRNLFSTKPSFYPSSRDLKYIGVEKLDEWISNIDKWIRYVSLGIDMRRYAYFDAHTPSISYALGGNHFTHFREGIEATDEAFGGCFKFVLDTALSFARDDFDFDYWSVRQALRERKSD